MVGIGGGQRMYSANPDDYRLLEEIGHGASATVYRAMCLPSNEVVAVKCLDLDRCNSNLDDIRKEAQTMTLIDHPNVIKALCSFVVDRYLWVVMPFMAEGSCLHLMQIAYTDGFEESAIRSILKETLKALDYLHCQGHIHRDVKAGNILLHTDGIVKLADFGVSACMFDTGDRQRARNTFVGTPCWMAPEVLQPGGGYDSKADIWSFGITALEMAHGHAPFSKYPPMKVLLMTIQNAPPGLDYDRDKKFSKVLESFWLDSFHFCYQAFKEMVAMCLVKDQTKRPTADKLLKHSFFKHAKPPELSVKKLFADLPPLWNRVKTLQLKDAAQLALKRMPSADQEALSQSEYKRGVSAWNFDIEDLKAQASLVRDDDAITETKYEDESLKSFGGYKALTNGHPHQVKHNSPSEIPHLEWATEASEYESLNQKVKPLEIDILEVDQEKLAINRNGSSLELEASTSENDVMQSKAKAARSRQTHSGPLIPGNALGRSSFERGRSSERFESEVQPTNEKSARKAPSFSGPLMIQNRTSANSSAPIKSPGGLRDSLDDKSKTNLVQIKGRFSVTSENLDLAKDVPSSAVQRRSSQTSPLRKCASVGDWVHESKPTPVVQSQKEVSNSNLPPSELMLHLQNLLQHNSNQQDLILNLLNRFQPEDITDAVQNGKLPPLPPCHESNGSVLEETSERERLLMQKISELHSRITTLTDELNAERLKSEQLLLNRRISRPAGRGGLLCRAELPQDAPFAAAIGACMLSSLLLPPATPPSDEDSDSGLDTTDARLAVMGIISFVPYFNWLSWVFAWLDTGKRRYAVYALVYLAPYIRSNLSLSPEDSWLPIASIFLGVIHVQLEASIKSGDIQGFQLFSEVSKLLSFTKEEIEDEITDDDERLFERRKEHRNLPSDISKKRDAKKKNPSSEHHERSNGDWD
ncbi:Serine/threonine-protein kinase fray2 [Linum grandiflorum]